LKKFEKLVYARGDGSGLNVFATDSGKMLRIAKRGSSRVANKEKGLKSIYLSPCY
jgi:hypothetical protein